MPDSNPSVAAELRQALHRLVIATSVLYAVAIAILVLVWADSSAKRDALHREADRTTKALCAFRLDVQRRVQTTQDFLLEHPKGIPGVPVAVLKNGLVAQEQTIKSLSGLKCIVGGTPPTTTATAPPPTTTTTP